MIGVGVHLEGVGEGLPRVLTHQPGCCDQIPGYLLSFCQSTSLGFESFLISSLSANMRSSR